MRDTVENMRNSLNDISDDMQGVLDNIRKNIGENKIKPGKNSKQ